MRRADFPILNEEVPGGEAKENVVTRCFPHGFSSYD